LEEKTGHSEARTKDLSGKLDEAVKLKGELEQKLAAATGTNAQVEEVRQKLEVQVKEMEAKNKQHADEIVGLNEKIVALNVQLQETVVARQKVEQSFTQKSESFSASVRNPCFRISKSNYLFIGNYAETDPRRKDQRI
jgi:predicted nuclease with TOPRIM domain